MEIISPSGRSYKWDKPEPPTQADFDALQRFDAEQGGAAAPSADAAEVERQNMRVAPTPYGVGMRLVDPATVGDNTAMAARVIPPVIGGGVAGPLGAAGGAMAGEYLGQVIEGRGAKPSLGAIGGAGVANLIPSGSLAAKTGLELVKKGAAEAIKQSLANTAGAATEQLVDLGRLNPTGLAIAGVGGALSPVIGKAADKGIGAQEAYLRRLGSGAERETFLEGLAAGAVFSPDDMTKLNPSFKNAVLVSVGGKAAHGQEASIRNQPVWQDMAADYIGVPRGTRFVAKDPETGRLKYVTEDMRAKLSKPYAELSSMKEQASRDLELLDAKSRLAATNEHEYQIIIGDRATAKERADLATKVAADVEKLKEARHNIFTGFKNAASDAGDPKAIAMARSAKKEAKELEGKIEEAAKLLGRNDLVDGLKAARKGIAKTYQLEMAINPGNGYVDPHVFGRALDKSIPLTEQALLMGRLAKSAPNSTKEVSRVGAPDSSQSKAGAALLAGASILGGAGGGAAGYAAGGMQLAAPLAAAAATIPFVAPKMARNVALSPFWQKNMIQTGASNYAMPDWLARAAAIGVRDATREPSGFMRFLEETYPRQDVRSQQPAPRPVPFR